MKNNFYIILENSVVCLLSFHLDNSLACKQYICITDIQISLVLSNYDHSPLLHVSLFKIFK